MKTENATNARHNLFKLVDLIADEGDVVNINGKRNNAELFPESDWRSIKETQYLLTIAGMRESIIDGLNTPVEECIESPEW